MLAIRSTGRHRAPLSAARPRDPRAVKPFIDGTWRAWPAVTRSCSSRSRPPAPAPVQVPGWSGCERCWGAWARGRRSHAPPHLADPPPHAPVRQARLQRKGSTLACRDPRREAGQPRAPDVVAALRILGGSQARRSSRPRALSPAPRGLGRALGFSATSTAATGCRWPSRSLATRGARQRASSWPRSSPARRARLRVLLALASKTWGLRARRRAAPFIQAAGPPPGAGARRPDRTTATPRWRRWRRTTPSSPEGAQADHRQALTRLTSSAPSAGSSSQHPAFVELAAGGSVLEIGRARRRTSRRPPTSPPACAAASRRRGRVAVASARSIVAWRAAGGRAGPHQAHLLESRIAMPTEKLRSRAMAFFARITTRCGRWRPQCPGRVGRLSSAMPRRGRARRIRRLSSRLRGRRPADEALGRQDVSPDLPRPAHAGEDGSVIRASPLHDEVHPDGKHCRRIAVRPVAAPDRGSA